LTLHFSEIDQDQCNPKPKKVVATEPATTGLDPCIVGIWRVTSIPTIHAAGLTITYTAGPNFTFVIGADGSVTENLDATGTTYTSSVDALVAVQTQGVATAHVNQIGRLGGFLELEVTDSQIVSFKATASVKGKSFDIPTNGIVGTVMPSAHAHTMALCIDHTHLRYITQTTAGNFRVDTERVRAGS
jgi:hypothetical protein